MSLSDYEIRPADVTDAPSLGRAHVRIWQEAYAGLMDADYLAGLDPRVGLYSSVIMAMAIAFTGGRPAMISAAAGAVGPQGEYEIAGDRDRVCGRAGVEPGDLAEREGNVPYRCNIHRRASRPADDLT